MTRQRFEHIFFPFFWKGTVTNTLTYWMPHSLPSLCCKLGWSSTSEVTMLSGVWIPIPRMPLSENSVITDSPLLAMDCDKPVGLTQEIHRLKALLFFLFFVASPPPASSSAAWKPCLERVASHCNPQNRVDSSPFTRTPSSLGKINTLYYYKIKL